MRSHLVGLQLALGGVLELWMVPTPLESSRLRFGALRNGSDAVKKRASVRRRRTAIAAIPTLDPFRVPLFTPTHSIHTYFL